MRLPFLLPTDVIRIARRSIDAAEELLGLVPRLVALVGQVEPLVARISVLVDRIDEIADGADGAVQNVRGLVDDLQPALVALQPTLDQLAHSTSPAEVEALVGLVDQLPELTKSLREDVLPILGTMDHVSGDLHDLMLLSRELNEMLAGVPGVRRLLTRNVGTERPALTPE